LAQDTAQRHSAGGGQRQGAPPAVSPTNTTTHATTPTNNNRMAGRQMSCSQQLAPPQRDTAKTSPRISIGQETALAYHDQPPPAACSHDRPEKTQLPIAEQNFVFSSKSVARASAGKRPGQQCPLPCRLTTLHLSSRHSLTERSAHTQWEQLSAVQTQGACG
jgi:hypothetical protein